MQGHIGGNPLERLHLEVGLSHPGLDGPEGMLDRLAPLAHLLQVLVEALLDALENACQAGHEKSRPIAATCGKIHSTS